MINILCKAITGNSFRRRMLLDGEYAWTEFCGNVDLIGVETVELNTFDVDAVNGAGIHQTCTYVVVSKHPVHVI